MLAATKARRRRRRRAAHREELHRRRHELRDGRRAGRRRRRRRGRRRWSPTTTSPCRTASTPPAAAASASPCCWRRSSARRPRRAAASPRSPTSPSRSTATAAAWAWRSRRARCPAAGKPTFDLPEDEMEVGIGIHGEPGRAAGAAGTGPRDRRDARRPDPRRPAFQRGDGVIAFVNGMGGTPLHRAVPDVQRGRADCSTRPASPSPARWSATTSPRLDMAGCSVTLLKVDDELLRLWDAPVDTPGLRWGALSDGRRRDRRRSSCTAAGCATFARVGRTSNATYLTELDSAIGDADHGANMDRGMTAVVAALDASAPARRRRRCSRRPA